MTAISDFRLREFNSDQAPDTFRSFLHAYSRGQVEELERLCTPTMAARAIKGVEQEVAETGGVRGAEVGSSLAAPETTAVRTWHPHDAQGTAAAPLVAQVTVKMTWELSPAFHAVRADATLAGMLASGLHGLESSVPTATPLLAGGETPAGGGRGEAGGDRRQGRGGKRRVNIVASGGKKQRRRGAAATGQPGPDVNLACVGTWWPAVDSASGHTFYFNDLTGATSWAIPAVLGLVEPSRPFLLTELGVEAEPYAGVAPPGIEGAGLAASAAQEGASGVGDDSGIVKNAVRLVTHVTFERLLTDIARDRVWRVAGLL